MQVHPTFLYESIWNLVLFVLLMVYIIKVNSFINSNLLSRII
ncbi:MAG TPA: hypothetical protein DEG71_01355 [Clostridiales bacterium]|nr:hypothetical protein [Clostridiales bacterium]